MKRLSVLLPLLLAPRLAAASPALLVAKGEGAVTSERAHVVLVKAGTKVALTMQLDYRGPATDVAVVIPIPGEVTPGETTTLDDGLLARLDRSAAPKLVELWEADPCAPSRDAGADAAEAGLAPPIVAPPAEYEAGLRTSKDVVATLRDKGYRLPAGVDLAAYPRFVLAKVDTTKLTFTDGRTVLPPIRVIYDAEHLQLPLAIGAGVATEAQDLVVHVVARERYEALNRPNVTLPTNLDVTPETRTSFDAFYGALFERTLAAHPGAVVTEHAAPATLSRTDLAELGVGAEKAADFEATAQLYVGDPSVKGQLTPAAVATVLIRRRPLMGRCFELGTRERGAREGRLELTFDVYPSGLADKVEVTGGFPRSVRACLVKSMDQIQFPPPGGTNGAKVTVPITVLSHPKHGAIAPLVSRLHLRHGKDIPDLVFRQAPPLSADPRVLPDAKTASQFEARFAVRHPWGSAVRCVEPRRGLWETRETIVSAVPPKGGSPLETYVDAAHLAAAPIVSSAPEAPRAPEPEAGPAAAPAPKPNGGCGCDTAAEPPFSLVALALVALRFRRRR